MKRRIEVTEIKGTIGKARVDLISFPEGKGRHVAGVIEGDDADLFAAIEAIVGEAAGIGPKAEG